MGKKRRSAFNENPKDEDTLDQFARDLAAVLGVPKRKLKKVLNLFEEEPETVAKSDALRDAQLQIPPTHAA